MKVMWPAELELRCLCDVQAGTFSIVSSRISANTTGLTLDTILLLVTDQSSEFRDLELRMVAERKHEGFLVNDNEEVLGDRVVLDVDESGVTWNYSRNARRLEVRLNGPPESWMILGENAISVGFTGSKLQAIVCRNVVPDEGGILEAEWLDEIEGAKE